MHVPGRRVSQNMQVWGHDLPARAAPVAGVPPCHLSIQKGRVLCAWGISKSLHVGRCVHEWVCMHKRVEARVCVRCLITPPNLLFYCRAKHGHLP